LVDQLAREGALHTPAWRSAFEQVPRHTFLPSFFRTTSDGRHEAIGHDHPDWLRFTYQDQAWATQLDGDDTAWDRAVASGPIHGIPTCSSTMPSLMALMLEELNLDNGHRVLEIGTGTGYNAALLAERLGSDAVTTVDVDAGLVAAAKAALAEAGYAPIVDAVDGTTGYPTRAPYDRLLATCSVAHIPTAWLAQVRPGGIILTYLYRELGGNLPVRLTVADDGSASGQFLTDWGYFMPARSHRGIDPILRLAEVVHEAGQTKPTMATLDGPALFLVALLTPGIVRLDFQPTGGEPQTWIFHIDGSWACYNSESLTVEQAGPTRLWDAVQRAYTTWTELDGPARNRFGLTISPSGAHLLWLDSPQHEVAVL
jgi:methyltransferase of ATP-grasp peptide maturase system